MSKYFKILTPTVLAIVLSIAACNQQQEKNKAKVAIEELQHHIDSLEARIVEVDGKGWARDNWKELEAEYNELKAKVNKELADTQSEDVVILEKKWEVISKDIQSYSPYSAVVVNVYSALGTSPEEFSMNFVTKENMLSKYKAFVETVKANKEVYSSKDWAHLDVLWEALNERKNELEPLDTKVNLKIAELKLEYGAMKTLEKTEAKVEEKAEQLQE